jgi:23S rRNA pseudouridine1911/1915/1917 synthase
MRLDLALIAQHPELSRRRARDVIEKGQVTLGGAVVLEAGLDVPSGAPIAWDPHRPARRRARSSIPLLFEDERVLVVDKPAGLLSVPTGPGGQEDTALGRVQEYVRHRRPRDPYVGRVHRIDRDTSGAVAFALDPDTRAALIELFKTHAIERRYWAIVRGVPPRERLRIDAPVHEAYEGGRRRLARPGEESRPAVTHLEVAERMGSAALVRLTLETGRQHQIRLHLAHIGHPIVGDRVYGTGRDPGRVRVARMMLHAASLAFDHPWTGGRLAVESPLPEDFEGTLRALRRTAGRP